MVNRLLILVSVLPTVLGIMDIVFVILSQGNKYNLRLARDLQNDLIKQSEKLHKEKPVIYLSHRDFPHKGEWTILPLIPRLSNLHGDNAAWIFFLEGHTRVRLEKLLDIIQKYNHREEIWFGYSLQDEEATIIHHFAFYENPEVFSYPNIACGFAMSLHLVNRVSKNLEDNITLSDFSIDRSHELALIIWNEGAGSALQHEPGMCIENNDDCATFVTQFVQCDDPVPKDVIYFAVKTCEKFHENRVPVVKKTWGQYVNLIKFFSDINDPKIPTIDLDIPNSDQGHCDKTLGIMRFISRELQESHRDVTWIVIADDDTILSVSRLQQLLSCYDSSEEIAIGERYGYNVIDERGYNYLTGGSGMVFSKPLVIKLAEQCRCPTPNTPDDMFLGVCMEGLDIQVTHSSAFHQARPIDYASEYLETEMAVSFHKHWMIDPIRIYKDWFEESDKLSRDSSNAIHKEL